MVFSTPEIEALQKFSWFLIELDSSEKLLTVSRAIKGLIAEIPYPNNKAK